jgi:hypothetical protein
MEYRGIQFDIKMGMGRHECVWTVHTPTPKQGKISGTRDKAVRAAKKAIQQWCYQHPAKCDPAPVGLTVGP